MAFQLIPFFDEPAWAMDWELDPWTSTRAPRGHAHLHSPLTQLNRMARQLDRLRSDLHVDGGVVQKDNSYGINLNVDGFQPKDINVSLQDDVLTVTGKHEEKSEDGSRFSSRQFTRSYRLPEHVQQEQMKSVLAADGRTLKIEAPILKPQQKPVEAPKEVPIAIDRK